MDNNVDITREKFENNSETQSMILGRKSNFSKSFSLIFGYLFFEIAKQLGNFSLSTSNGNKMPIPTTFLVIMVEVTKLILVLFWAKISKSPIYEHGFSFKFGLPGLCYFITNVVYLHALTITSPPIWMALIQTRTLYTAALYKVVFKKDVTNEQVLGCFLIVISIVLTRVSEISSGRVTISLYLFGISQFAALLSTFACVAVELFLKNDCRSFSEQQFWLYSWGIILASLTLLLPNNSFSSVIESLQDIKSKPNIIGSVAFATLATACAGLCIPCIIRNLDSIVKDYLTALNNILLALLTAILFPLYFPFNSIYAASLLVLISGIIIYEKKTIDLSTLFYSKPQEGVKFKGDIPT